MTKRRLLVIVRRSRGALGTLDPSQHSLKPQVIKQRVRKTLLNVQTADK